MRHKLEEFLKAARLGRVGIDDNKAIIMFPTKADAQRAMQSAAGLLVHAHPAKADEIRENFDINRTGENMFGQPLVAPANQEPLPEVPTDGDDDAALKAMLDDIFGVTADSDSD